MSDVYLAHQRLGVVERLCVVKTVRPELAANKAALRRFVDEARTSALVSHKNIANVLDVGDVDGTAFIAVEYVAGRDLSAVFKRARRLKQPIPEDVTLYIMGELLDALAYVHRATDPRTGAPLHIVHRDVSPQNILFDGEKEQERKARVALL
jgi:serine/threonine protein kinase